MQALAGGMPVAFHLWVFVVGAMVGSFLNVVIARVPKGESIVSPGSRCPRCRNPIAWYDNIPVVSWLLLRGKCRKCGLPISIRYPLVELLTAVLAVAVVRRFGPEWTAVGYFVFVAALVALTYIDIDTWLLPHQITWPLLALGLVSPLWNSARGFPASLIGAGAGFAFFAAIALFGEWVLKRETMGWGDVWLLAGIGAWLGWQELPKVVLFSALQGSLVGIALILAGRDPAKKAAAPSPAEPAAPAEVTAPVPSPEATAPAAPAEAAPAAPAEATAPAAPAEAHTADDDWSPPKHAVPFGPFLALAALEVLLAGPVVAGFWDRTLGRLLP
jgi:leader peptidase (prepilin peptidase)/N-methyltransferase